MLRLIRSSDRGLADISAYGRGCPTLTYSTNVLTATLAGANFTAYQELKKLAQRLQPERGDAGLPSYQHMLIGLVSGAMGPLTNAPIDTIKTRACPSPFSYSHIPSVTNAHSFHNRPANRRSSSGTERRGAHRGARARHVARGGPARVLQGPHAARAARRARPGGRVRGVRARAARDGDAAGEQRGSDTQRVVFLSGCVCSVT